MDERAGTMPCGQWEISVLKAGSIGRCAYEMGHSSFSVESKLKREPKRGKTINQLWDHCSV